MKTRRWTIPACLLGCAIVAATLAATAQTSRASSFTLSSPDVAEGGALPVAYTCDGTADTIALNWSGAPAGTQSYALIMHHVAGPNDIHWHWVLYDIPANSTSLARNSTGVGTLGTNSVNGRTEYAPPCSAGPGPKVYTYTVYALSARPQLSVPPDQVSRAVLLEAMNGITLGTAELGVTYTRRSSAITPGPQTPGPSGTQEPGGGPPPTEAVAACNAKAEESACSFTDQNGEHTGVCKLTGTQMACAPSRGPDDGRGAGSAGPTGPKPSGAVTPGPGPGGGQGYNTEQAISDKAQGMTIAFDALAFLTGDLGSDSFFPPGKVADFWGFQYLRDNDPSVMGHAGDFLTSAAYNVLNTLTADQRAQLGALAKSQVASINDYAYKRFVLMKAFRRLVSGDLPSGTTGLSEDAVKAYSAQLYQLDGQISYERAKVMGSLVKSLDAKQLAYLDAMVGKGMLTWPTVSEPADLKGLDRDTKIAVMTYAADMFSWYAGSVDADVYFCPERHGTYFGSFYLKDMPAMSNSGYAIPTNLTGDMGDAMLNILTPEQAKLITGLVDIQKPYLLGIVDTRRQISEDLREFRAGESVDSATVLGLMDKYGQLDGEISYNLAVNFTKVAQSLTADQKAKLLVLRKQMLGDLLYPSGAFLYSQPITMPQIPNTDFLFGTSSTSTPTTQPAQLPGQGSMTFPQTGKSVTGIFLKYWQANGGLMQLGFPISAVMSEKSDLDGKVYTVQYFERAVMEYHPENKAPYQVLLSQLGALRYRTLQGTTPGN